MLRACAKEHFSRFQDSQKRDFFNRLGQWYEHTDECFAAAKYYDKAGNWDALLRTVGDDQGLSFGPERLALVREWMERCPNNVILRHPEAIIVFILLLFYARDIPQMHRYHALLERSMELCTDLPKSKRDQLEGEALLRLSFLCFNDISAMSTYHRRIKALLTTDRNPWTQGSPSVLMLYHSKKGNLDYENAEMSECMPIYSNAAGGHGSGAAIVMLGETELMRGNFANAAIYCQQAENIALANHEFRIYTAAEFLKARLAVYERTQNAAFDILDAAAEALMLHNQYSLLITIEFCRAWIASLLGKKERIASWIFDEDSSNAQIFPIVDPIFQVIINATLLSERKWTHIAASTPQNIKACSASNFTLCLLYIHLQNAVAFMHMGKNADAKMSVAAAWSIAEPDGILLPFAEADRCLDPFFSELIDYKTGKRLRILAEQFRSITSISDQPALRNLTPREKEIALLISKRNSSKEIADKLCISVKSVNNRLNTIYEKLGLGGQGRNKRQMLIQLIEGEI